MRTVPGTARLAQTGRLRPPRRSTLLRLLAVAALLLTAAGVLHSGAPGEAAGRDDRATGETPAGPPPGPTAVPSVGPSVTDPARGVPDGRVGVAVPLAEPAAGAVLRPGDRVDLLRVPAEGGEPLLVAGQVAVLAVEPVGATLLLALTDGQARSVLSAAAGTRFAVVVRP